MTLDPLGSVTMTAWPFNKRCRLRTTDMAERRGGYFCSLAVEASTLRSDRGGHLTRCSVITEGSSEVGT